MSDPSRLIEVFMFVAVFGLVMALWVGGVVFWSAHRRAKVKVLRRRLGLEPAEDGEGRVLRLWHEGQESTLRVPGRRQRLSIGKRLDRIRVDAGFRTPLHTLGLGLTGGLAMLASIVLVLTQSVPAAAAAAVAALALAWTLVKHRVKRREARFESQFLDALGLAARSLRAGHPLSGAFMVISEEIAAPVGPLFTEIRQQQELGMGMEDALRNVIAKTPNHDLRIFATSIIVHLRSGGNLADLMDRIAAVIRDRVRLNRRVRALTASAQLGKRVLLTLPILLMAALNALNPEYMDPLYSTGAGRTMLLLAVVGLLFGRWIMGRMATLDY